MHFYSSTSTQPNWYLWSEIRKQKTEIYKFDLQNANDQLNQSAEDVCLCLSKCNKYSKYSLESFMKGEKKRCEDDERKLKCLQGNYFRWYRRYETKLFSIEWPLPFFKVASPNPMMEKNFKFLTSHNFLQKPLFAKKIIFLESVFNGFFSLFSHFQTSPWQGVAPSNTNPKYKTFSPSNST